MKKRTAFIGVILSIIPLGQSLFIKTGAFFSSSAVMLLIPEKVKADGTDFYFNRAFDKAENGDYYGAISDYTKVIEINPNDSTSYYNRGLAKHNLEDYYGAISDYTKAIELDPNDGLIYSNLGITKGIGFNDDEGACDDFKKSASLGYQYRIDWLQSFDGKWCNDM